MVGVSSYAYVYSPTGTPTEQIGPHGSILYYLYDRQGSTVALADSDGHVVARYAYTPYGSRACGLLQCLRMVDVSMYLRRRRIIRRMVAALFIR